MQILELLYEKPPLQQTFYSRKISLEQTNTLLSGANGSGKTALILDFLANCKNFLYIDLDDLRVKKDKIAPELKNFCKEKGVKILAIDNFCEDFALPKDVELILSTTDKTLHVEGLTNLHLDMLDFEEFISFRKGFASPESIFGLYASHGKMAGCVNENEPIPKLQEHLKITLGEDLEIFSYFAQAQSRAISINQIYTELKNRIKISKDRLYALSQKFENCDLIHFLAKYNSPKSAKKLYLGNFVFKDAITYEKEFARKFQNMVFCELYSKQKEIFYTDFLDFYAPLTKTAIICSPFAPTQMIIKKFDKIQPHMQELGITRVKFVTMGNEQKHFHEGLTCEIVPFWDWALQN